MAVGRRARGGGWLVVVAALASPALAEVDFWWAPASPEAGEQVTFTIVGVDEVTTTEWSFGQPG